MKRMKADTKLIFKMDGTFAGGVDIRTWHIRKRWWRKARTPGTVRKSRMPGGSGFRNHVQA